MVSAVIGSCVATVLALVGCAWKLSARLTYQDMMLKVLHRRMVSIEGRIENIEKTEADT